jgi:hypothetical protein
MGGNTWLSWRQFSKLSAQTVPLSDMKTHPDEYGSASWRGKPKGRGRATWTELDGVTSADAVSLFATVQNQLTLSGGRL